MIKDPHTFSMYVFLNSVCRAWTQEEPIFEVPSLFARSRVSASDFFFSIRAICSGDSSTPPLGELVSVEEDEEEGGGEVHGVFLGSGELSSSSATRGLV